MTVSCKVIPLFYTAGRCTANTPSIDRIDNTQGYTKDNIVVVSGRVNDLKKDASLQELRLIADFYERISNG